jgi:hypothetical protein
MRFRLVLACVSAVALVAVAGGCGSAAPPAVSSLGPQKVEHAPPGAIAGPYVPAGAVLSVRADQPLDSYYSAPGSSFTATVQAPLRDSSGRVLVVPGAKVRGAFASFGTHEEPRVRISLTSIDTVDGTVPLSAAVRRAQHVNWAGPPELAPRASYQFPYDFLEYGTTTAYPPYSSSPSIGYQIEQPKQVHVPSGAYLELQLTAPLTVFATSTQPR